MECQTWKYDGKFDLLESSNFTVIERSDFWSCRSSPSSASPLRRPRKTRLCRSPRRKKRHRRKEQDGPTDRSGARAARRKRRQHRPGDVQAQRRHAVGPAGLQGETHLQVQVRSNAPTQLLHLAGSSANPRARAKPEGSRTVDVMDPFSVQR